MAAFQKSWLPEYGSERRLDGAIAVGGLLTLLVAGIALSIYASLGVASLTVGGVLLSCGLTLLATGRGFRGLPPEIRHSGSPAAVRWVGAALVLWAADLVAGGLLWLTSSQPSPEFFADTWFFNLVVVISIGTLPRWLSWRAVRKDPGHPAHSAIKPYFWGNAPSSRLAIVAGLVGAITFVIAVFTLFHFQFMPLVTIPLAALTFALGLGALLLQTLARQPYSRVLPTSAIVAALLTIGATALAGSMGAALSGAACATPTSCLFVGGNDFSGTVIPVEDGAAQASLAVSGAQHLAAVSCPTAELCVAVGQGQGGGVIATFRREGRGRWSQVAVYQVPNQLSGIGCETTSVCVAVGSGSVEITNGSPGPIHSLTGITLSGIACPTSSLCVAVGSTGTPSSSSTTAIWAPIRSGVVGASQAVPGASWLTGIACSSSTDCLAVGEDDGYGVVVPISSNRAGAVTVVGTAIEAYSISCPMPDVCAIVGPAVQTLGPADALVAIRNGKPEQWSTLPSGDGALVCLSVTRCLVAGSQSDQVVTVSIP